MSISSVSGSSPLQTVVANQAALSAAQASPAAEAQALLASSDSALFASLGQSASGLPDLSGLTAAAQAYSLYTNPALVQQLATAPSSQAGALPNATGDRTAALATPISYAFDPFDESSWWSNPASLGSVVDSTA